MILGRNASSNSKQGVDANIGNAWFQAGAVILFYKVLYAYNTYYLCYNILCISSCLVVVVPHTHHLLYSSISIKYNVLYYTEVCNINTSMRYAPICYTTEDTLCTELFWIALIMLE